MKKLFGLVAVFASALAMSLTVNAETIKVFVSNIGQVTSFGKNADFTAMLHDNDVDFGYVCGPKAVAYFSFTDADYTFDNKNIASGYGGLHVFTYRTDRYELLKRYDKTSCISGGIDACVVSNVVNHKVYSFVMPTATSFVTTKTGLPNLSQLGLVANVINACVAEYPDSKVVVGTALAWGDDMLRDYLSGEDSAVGLLAYSQPEDWTGADCGAIYIEDASDLNKANSSTQAIDSFTTKGEPTIIATIVYSANTHHVVFKNGDEVLSEQDVEDGAGAVPPEMPEVDPGTGFVFMGWDPNTIGNITEDITFSAIYSDPATILFTVKFLDANGEEIPEGTQSVGWGSDAVPPTPPTVEGMTFVKWLQDYTSVKSDLVIESLYRFNLIPIASAEDFVKNVPVYGPDGTDFVLMDDIDLSGASFTSAAMSGVFNGNGHIISNLSEKALFSTVYGTVSNLTLSCFARQAPGGNSPAGLLADALRGATVSDVQVIDSALTAKNSNCDLGLIASTVQTNSQGVATVISNCTMRNSTLTGIYGCVVGGLVSKLGRGCVVSDCQFICDDKSMSAIGNAVNNAGGIAGHVDGGTIVRCLVDAKITGGNGVENGCTAAGGIVGGMSGAVCSVFDCTNRADVSFSSVDGGAGGIVGRVMKATLKVGRCVNFGAVSASGDDEAAGSGCGVGGIVGGGWGTSPSVSICVFDSQNNGEVSSSARHPAGGLVGCPVGLNDASTYLYLTNCVNIGAVESAGHAGGLVGRLLSPNPEVLAVVNCGNAGAVHSATNCVGGIFGALDGQGQNNDKSFTYRNFKNIMNCGALTTDTGSVGSFAGRFRSTERNAYSAPLESAFFSEQSGEIELVGVYEGKESAGVTVDESSQIAMAANDFTNHKAVKALNVFAKANGLMNWVQTKEYPDLSLWGVPFNPGLTIFFR